MDKRGNRCSTVDNAGLHKKINFGANGSPCRKFPVVFCVRFGYNKINLRCAATPVSFEPTDTLNGIPTLSGGCQALTHLVRIGREGKCTDCGHPPSIARSQKAGIGISGIIEA